jgi:hypothetical protein
MPFISFPSTMTALQLRQERPMLWLAVMCVSWRVLPKQMDLCEHFRRLIAQKVLLENQRSMDILLAVLTFVTWSQYGRKDQPFLSVFVQLAVAIVWDLGLNKAPADIGPSFSYWKVPKDAVSRVWQEVPPPPRQPTMEDGRATLICFFLTST